MSSAAVPAVRDAARARGLGLRALVVVLAVPFAAPLAYLMVRNVEEGGVWSTLTDDAFLAPFGRSMLLATTVAAAAAVVGTLAAWLAMRTDLPGRRVMRLLLPLPLTLSVLFLPLPLFLTLLPGYQRFTRLLLLDGGGLHSQRLAFEILLDRRRQAAAAPRPAQRSGQSLPTGEERQGLCIAQ